MKIWSMNMFIFRKMILFSTLFFLSCSPSDSKAYRFAMDSSFRSLQSPTMASYAVGFFKDFLMNLSKNYQVSFERFNEDRSYLLKGLDEKKYDLILSDIYPLNFYTNKYAFSSLIIPTGPVLLLRKNREGSSLKDLENKVIAVQEVDLSQLDLTMYPKITIQLYASNLDAINDVIRQKVDGALIRYIPAISYVEDTFYESLKIVGEPLNDRGLRFMTLKEEDHFIQKIDRTFAKMKRQSSLQKLLTKWDMKVSAH